MRANFVLSALTAAALLSGGAASATVLTVMPGTPTFSGMSVHGEPRIEADLGTNPANAPAGAETLAPEPETYAFILAGLMFVGLRMRDQRR